MRWRAIVWLLVVFSLPTPAVGQTESVREAQVMLRSLGFDPGSIDGFTGPRTAAALSDFQASAGLTATGTLDERTLDALKAKSSLAVERDGSAAILHGQGLSDEAIRPGRSEADVPTPEPAPSASERAGTVAVAPGETNVGSSLAAFGGMAALVFVLLLIRRNRARRRSAEAGRAPLGASSDRPIALRQRNDQIERSATGGSREADCWVPPSASIEVSGLRIGGMVYVGRDLRIEDDHYPENCLIDPSLAVARKDPDVSGALMPYWPSYSSIDPRSRLAYLQWLAGGRNDGHFGVGYAFLFFYGLERRIVLEACGSAERAVLAEEVLRLRTLFSASHSFRRYADELLDVVAVLDGASDVESTITDRPGWEVPIAVRLAIGRRVEAEEALDSDLLLAWWWNHPDSRPRTPATRALPEFRQLFGLRFAERYPNGLRIPRPKRPLSFRYRAASDTFEVDLTPRLGDLRDITALTAPIKIADSIAAACTQELAPFSRFLGRNPGGRGTLEAHALLPADLAKLVPSRELDELKDWAERKIADQNGLVPVVELLSRLEGQAPTKVARRALLSAADALARLGIGMAPDPRYALRGPKIGEPVVLFALPDNQTDLAAVSAAYPGALLSVTLGAYVAHADGVITSDERHRLERIVRQLDELSMAEAARLYANLYWALAVPPSLGQLRRHLGRLSADARQHLGRISIAVAGSDGQIDASEVDALRKLYRALDLPPDSVFADLNAIAAPPARAPVTVRPAQPSTGDFAVPPPPRAGAAPSPPEFQLDHDQITAIIADTTKVSQVLGDIFRQDEPEEPTPFEEDEDGAAAFDGPYQGLDPGHRSFAEELASRDRWTQREFDALAARFGLMSGGALETLNEWAYDTWNEELVEEDGDLFLNPNILESLGKFGQGERHDAA